MATPLMRVNFFYKDILGKGWSETFYSSLTDYSATMNRAKILFPLLINLRGTGVNLEEIRVSDDNTKRDSSIYVPPLVDQVTAFPGFEAGDFSDTCLLIRLEATPLNRRSWYLSGIPDIYTVNNGEWIPGSVWGNNYTQVTNELLNSGNWGMKYQTVPVSTNPCFVSAQSVTNGDITMTTQNAHGFSPGTLVNVLGFRGTHGINGRHVVKSVPTATTFTFKSVFFTTPVVGVASCYALNFAFLAFTKAIQMRLVEHKRGRPIAASRGHR